MLWAWSEISFNKKISKADSYHHEIEDIEQKGKGLARKSIGVLLWCNVRAVLT